MHVRFANKDDKQQVLALLDEFNKCVYQKIKSSPINTGTQKLTVLFLTKLYPEATP